MECLFWKLFFLWNTYSRRQDYFLLLWNAYLGSYFFIVMECLFRKTKLFFLLLWNNYFKNYFLLLWNAYFGSYFFTIMEHLFHKLFFYYYGTLILEGKTVFYCYGTSIVMEHLFGKLFLTVLERLFRNGIIWKG